MLSVKGVIFPIVIGKLKRIHNYVGSATMNYQKIVYLKKRKRSS